MILDRLPVLLTLLIGFLWLRNLTRKVEEDHPRGIMMAGVFVLLPGLLVFEKWFFGGWHWAPAFRMPVECASLGVTFAAVGLAFCSPYAYRLERLSPWKRAGADDEGGPSTEG